MRVHTALLLGLAAAGPLVADAADTFAPTLYRATIETGLPHLEENLRYATTRETLCLGERQFATAFPILRHVALAGCTLGDARTQADTVSYTLRCAPGSETTGAAHWRVEPVGLIGTLDVKLGAKNMTLYQRISGSAVGACTPGD